MATIKSRIRHLEQQQYRRMLERFIRQAENRSVEELYFFVLHGYFEALNDNQRVVKAEEVRALEEKLRAIGVEMRCRSKAARNYFIEHGSWPERERSPAKS